MNHKVPKAIILSDGKPGHFHQSIALCKHLGVPFEICEVEFPSGFMRGLSHLLDCFGIHSSKIFSLKSDIQGADLVVSAGSRTYYGTKTLAKQLNAKSIAILAPRGYRWNFDVLLIPDYDHPPEGKNVVSLPVNLSYMEEDEICKKVEEFQQRHKVPDQNVGKVGILLGGDNKAGKMNPNEIASQLDTILERHSEDEIWVTTSRRTPKAVEDDLKSRGFAYLHLFSEEPYNPIPAFIHLGNHLYVTTDSTSMLSECVSNGSSTVSLIQTTCSAKHRSMVENLKKRNLIDTNRKIDISQAIHKIRTLLNFHV